MKKYFIFILIMSVFISKPAFAGTLTCSAMTTSSCTATPGGVVVYRMSASSNAHAELPAQSNYNSDVICCSGVVSLSNACTGVTVPPSSVVVLRLSGNSNAHAEENTENNSGYNGQQACLSTPVGSTITIGYVTGAANVIGTTCTGAGYDTTLGSLSSSTNAHVGGPINYARKICASASNPPVSGSLTSSVFDTGIASGSVGYNSIMWKGTLGGTNSDQGLVSFQFAAAPVSSGPWVFYGNSTGTCGPSDWFNSTGPNQPVELKGIGCSSYWNNKQYFRYKVKICSSNLCTLPGVYPSPTVEDVVVNWSP
ncbi:MAG: hypothetical protein WAV23_00675 [Minisyncoccia bacterium]